MKFGLKNGVLAVLAAAAATRAAGTAPAQIFVSDPGFQKAAETNVPFKDDERSCLTLLKVHKRVHNLLEINPLQQSIAACHPGESSDARQHSPNFRLE